LAGALSRCHDGIYDFLVDVIGVPRSPYQGGDNRWNGFVDAAVFVTEFHRGKPRLDINGAVFVLAPGSIAVMLASE